MTQLELFDEFVQQENDIEVIRTEWNRTRKALFMKVSACEKKYHDVDQRLSILEFNICKGRLVV